MPDCLSAAEHAWQSALQAVLQQAPSMQNPDAHSRHGDDLQSPLAATLQEPPCAFCSWQVPFAAQKSAGRQSASEMHDAVHRELVPLHASPLPHAGLPGSPVGACAHVPSAGAPSALAHTSHAPPHVVVQQTPSETKPLPHVTGLDEGCPFLSLQAPVALQVTAPTHVSGSSAFVTATHAPVPDVHVVQAPSHAPEQQIPSLQTPEMHSPGTEHVSPPAAR